MVIFWYAIIVVIGILYALIREIYCLDFPVFQKFHIDLPAFLFLWGFVGSMNSGEPLSFFIASIFAILISSCFLIISETEDMYQKMKGEIAIVDIPIKPKTKGQIILRSNNGIEYIVAENLGTQIKPLLRGTQVRIHHFKGVIAQVYEDARLTNDRQRKRINKYSKIIDFFKRPRNGKCMICGSGNRELLLITCPSCKYDVHKDHLETWLQFKNFCPACRSTISLKGGKIKLEVQL